MLRQNVFIGTMNSQHYVRYILEGDVRVSTPIMSSLRPGRTLEQSYSRVGMGNPLLLKLLFDNVNAQEGAYYIHHLDDKMVQLVLPNLPSGSRLWFFKHSNIDKHVREHYDYIEPVKHSKFFMKTLNFKQKNLNLDQIKKSITVSCQELDIMANRYRASPWETFNLGNFFEDGSNIPSELLVRVKTI
jgi:hypothetical protein